MEIKKYQVTYNIEFLIGNIKHLIYPERITFATEHDAKLFVKSLKKNKQNKKKYHDIKISINL